VRQRFERHSVVQAWCERWFRRSREPALACLAGFLTTALLFATEASAQQAPAPLSGGADAVAVCTAFRLAAEGVRLADQLSETAADRLDRAKDSVRECRERQCPRDDLLTAEQEVREAQYALVRATELATAMRRRQEELDARLLRLRGDRPDEKCEDAGR
jgi:hypothetical protein